MPRPSLSQSPPSVSSSSVFGSSSGSCGRIGPFSQRELSIGVSVNDTSSDTPTASTLQGGIDAWKKAGLPVTVDRTAPIPVMRQVQIAAGGLVVLGAVLGATVAPAFYLLSGFVGAGLVFAGTTGFCGMARILEMMPWNRARPPDR